MGYRTKWCLLASLPFTISKLKKFYLFYCSCFFYSYCCIFMFSSSSSVSINSCSCIKVFWWCSLGNSKGIQPEKSSFKTPRIAVSVSGWSTTSPGHFKKRAGSLSYKDAQDKMSGYWVWMANRLTQVQRVPVCEIRLILKLKTAMPTCALCSAQMLSIVNAVWTVMVDLSLVSRTLLPL